MKMSLKAAIAIGALLCLVPACDGQQIDATTEILASNVIIESHTNALTSDNLQDALDSEIAIDLGQLLPGTTWSVANKTRDENYEGYTGQITFAETGGTFTIDSGRFAAPGILHPDEDLVVNEGRSAPVGAVGYEILSNTVLYLRWDTTRDDVDDAIINVVARSTDTLVLTGTGGSGLIAAKISVLTKN